MKRATKRSVLAVVATLLTVAPAVRAAELHPLSAQDAARVQQLLSGFDPSTYEFLYKHTDSKGKVQTGRLGSAVGLGNIRQENTVAGLPGNGAGTVNTNCPIFKSSLPAITINIFKVAVPGQAGFKNAGDLAKANELNGILKSYYH